MSTATLRPIKTEEDHRAAVDSALPLYEADLAKPNHERELTADLESGEFYDYATGEGQGV